MEMFHKHYPFLLIDITYKIMVRAIFQDLGAPFLHILISISTGAYAFCDPRTFHVLLATKYKMQKTNYLKTFMKRYCII